MKNLIGRVPILAWFLLVALVFVVGGVLLVSKMSPGTQKEDATKPEKVSKEVLGTEVFSIVSREHIESGTPGSKYNSDPPTSGPHWNGPANKGVYDKELPDEQLIHNLEHGYIWISYRPGDANLQASSGANIKGATEEEVNKLKAIVEKDNWKVVMVPRSRDQAKIVLAAWGRVLKLSDFDEKRIKDFISTYRNRGPEKTMESN
jgi:hypothetical protein